MEYFTKLKVALDFIETRIADCPSDAEVAGEVNFSLPHFRSVFRTAMGVGIASYIRERRLFYAAFRIRNSNDSILDIALDSGFGSHEAFTRAFAKLFGSGPADFRRNGNDIDYRVITPGIMGPVLIREKPMNQSTKELVKENGSARLLGVRKISYQNDPVEVTPFPSALLSCLLYMDRSVSYEQLLCASGAAFRLMWNTTMWDGGNVDITYLRDDFFEPLRRACHAAGFELNMLHRAENGHNTKLTEGVKTGSRSDFLEMIKTEINAGRPLVGFGIIGPPEGCVISGYFNDGSELCGWNFFQGMPEFSGNIAVTEEGYFVKPAWYENPDTMGVLALDRQRPLPEPRDFLKEALGYAAEIMSPRRVRDCAGGLDAFDAWAKAITDENEFPASPNMDQLFERLTCHADACTMVGEGRWYASTWTARMAADFPEAAEALNKLSVLFRKTHDQVWKLWDLIGGIGMGQTQARNLAKADVRRKSAAIIRTIRGIEEQCIPLLREAAVKL